MPYRITDEDGSTLGEVDSEAEVLGWVSNHPKQNVYVEGGGRVFHVSAIDATPERRLVDTQGVSVRVHGREVHKSDGIKISTGDKLMIEVTPTGTVVEVIQGKFATKPLSEILDTSSVLYKRLMELLKAGDKKNARSLAGSNKEVLNYIERY